MKSPRILTILLTAFFFVATVVPESADPAGLDIRQFDRWMKKGAKRIGKKVKRGVTFVAEVPGKLEYRMMKAGVPPVVAVFASNVILKKMIANPKFAKAYRRSRDFVRIEKKINEFDRQVRELKQYYREESEKVYQSAFKLLENQNSLSSRMLPENISYEKFKASWLQMENLATQQLKLSEKLKETANKMGRNRFLKIARKMAIEKTFGAFKKIVTTELAEEILKSTEPDVIITALRTGLTVDAVLAKIVEKDVEKELALQGAQQEFDAKKLAKRITSQLKQQLKMDRDFYRKNGRTFVKQSVAKDLDKRKAATGYLLADFELEPDNGMAPLSVKFDASDSEGKIKEYKWDFGDKTAKGSGKTTSHTYQQKGRYDVKLTVVGETGIAITSDAQTVKVQPKPSPPSISLSVQPTEVNPGEKVTIKAKLNLGTIKTGKLTITFKVGSTSLKSEVVEGDLDYGDEFTREYSVPEKADAGKRVVSTTPTTKLSEVDAEKYKRSTFVGNTATASFNVKGIPKGMAAFIGRWELTEKWRDVDTGTTQQTGYTDFIAVSDNQFAAEFIDPVTGETEEKIFTVKENTASFRKILKESGDQVEYTTILNITSQGKLSGTGTAKLLDPTDPSGAMSFTVDISGRKLKE